MSLWSIYSKPDATSSAIGTRSASETTTGSAVAALLGPDSVPVAERPALLLLRLLAGPAPVRSADHRLSPSALSATSSPRSHPFRTSSAAAMTSVWIRATPVWSVCPANQFSRSGHHWCGERPAHYRPLRSAIAVTPDSTTAFNRSVTTTSPKLQTICCTQSTIDKHFAVTHRIHKSSIILRNNRSKTFLRNRHNLSDVSRLASVWSVRLTNGYWFALRCYIVVLCLSVNASVFGVCLSVSM